MGGMVAQQLAARTRSNGMTARGPLSNGMPRRGIRARAVRRTGGAESKPVTRKGTVGGRSAGVVVLARASAADPRGKDAGKAEEGGSKPGAWIPRKAATGLSVLGLSVAVTLGCGGGGGGRGGGRGAGGGRGLAGGEGGMQWAPLVGLLRHNSWNHAHAW